MEENRGSIKVLNQKGFGFIKVPGMEKDLFFHAQALQGVNFQDLKQGDVVVFEGIESTTKGRQAYGVTLA